MINFLMGLAINTGVTAALYFGLDGQAHMYSFGFVMCWILVVCTALSIIGNSSKEKKEEMIEFRKQWFFTAKTTHGALWKIPITYLLITGGHATFAAFYVILHILYYVTVFGTKKDRVKSQPKV